MMIIIHLALQWKHYFHKNSFNSNFFHYNGNWLGYFVIIPREEALFLTRFILNCYGDYSLLVFLLLQFRCLCFKFQIQYPKSLESSNLIDIG